MLTAMSRFFGSALAAVILMSGVAGAQDSNPHTGDAEAIAEGERLWVDVGCYACHGTGAEGAVGPDLTDDVWVYRPTDKTVFRAIAKGRRGTVMAPFADILSDDEIWKVVAWIRSRYQGDPAKIIW